MSSSTTTGQGIVSALGQIYPETGSRLCNNPPCGKQVGGGHGKWMRCSACLGVSYCSRVCQASRNSATVSRGPSLLHALFESQAYKSIPQKQNWPEHKRPCKITVEERKKKSLEGDDPEEAHLVGAYLEAWTRLTDPIVKNAGRSALRLDREDSLVETHMLEVCLEWQGPPPKVDFRDNLAILQRFRLVDIYAQKADCSPETFELFKQGRRAYLTCHGFIFIARVVGTEQNAVNNNDFMTFMPYPNHSYIFRKAFGRPIALDLNWEATFQATLEMGLDKWPWDKPEEQRDGHSMAHDVNQNEGTEAAVRVSQLWEKHPELRGWPSRKV